eukprot:jgi/Mesvir1/3258/Mv16396-RA.1
MGKIQTVVRVVSQQAARRPKGREAADHDVDVAWKIEGSVLKRVGAESDRGNEDCGNLYSCGRVYGPSVDTVEVYRNSIREVVQRLTEGQPGMVITWGCGGAGTALAMQGRNGYPGPVPFAITDIYTAIQQQTHRSFLVRLSFGELRELADGTEDVRDLLEGMIMRKRAASGNGTHAERQLLDKLAPVRPKGHPLRHLSEHVVCSASQALLLLSAGWERHSGKDADAGTKAKASAGTPVAATQPAPVAHPVLRLVVESVSHDEARPSPGNRGSPAPDWMPEKHTFHGSAALVIVGVTSSTPVTAGDDISKAPAQRVQSKAVDALLEVMEDRVAKASSKPTKGTGKEHPGLLQQLLQPALDGTVKTVALLHADLGPAHVAETQATLRFGSTLNKLGGIPKRSRQSESTLGHGDVGAGAHPLGGAAPAIEAFWEEITRMRQVLQRQHDRGDTLGGAPAIQGQLSDLQQCIIGGPPSVLEQHGEIARESDGPRPAGSAPEDATEVANAAPATHATASHPGAATTPGPVATPGDKGAGSAMYGGEGYRRATAVTRQRERERSGVSPANGARAQGDGGQGAGAGSFRIGAMRLRIASLLGLVRQHERCAQCLAWHVWRARVREARLERGAGKELGAAEGASAATPSKDTMELTRQLRARLNAKDHDVAQLQGELEDVRAQLADALHENQEAAMVAQELGQEVARLSAQAAEEQGNAYTLRQKAELLLTMIHAESDKERCIQLLTKAINNGHVDKARSRISRDGADDSSNPHGCDHEARAHAHPYNRSTHAGRQSLLHSNNGAMANSGANNNKDGNRHQQRQQQQRQQRQHPATPEPAVTASRDYRPHSATKQTPPPSASPASKTTTNLTPGAVRSGGKYKMPWDPSVGMGITSAWPMSGSLASRMPAATPGVAAAAEEGHFVGSTGSPHVSFAPDGRSPLVGSKGTPGRTPQRSSRRVQGRAVDGGWMGGGQTPASPREIASSPFLDAEEGDDLQILLEGELSEEQVASMVPPEFFKSKWVVREGRAGGRVLK